MEQMSSDHRLMRVDKMILLTQNVFNMKKINFRGLTETLSANQLKNILGGSQPPKDEPCWYVSCYIDDDTSKHHELLVKDYATCIDAEEICDIPISCVGTYCYSY